MINTICNFLSYINNLLWGNGTLILVFAAGIFLTVRCGFVQFRDPLLLLKKTLFAPRKENSGQKNGISRLQALSTALGASMGTGNIIGVAAAISVGGCGAIFWMVLSAFFVMALAFTENVLGVRYKLLFKNEKRSCGPLIYLSKGLKSPAAAVVYAAVCIAASFVAGNMSQVNSAVSSLDNLGFSRRAAGIVFAAAVGFMIFRGSVFIAKAAEKIIPIVSLVYIFVSLAVIVIYRNNIADVLICIVKSAFGFRQAAGGILGAIINKSLSIGLRRGVFSNEAGLGSSVFAHTSAECDEPAVMGLWAVLEVFIDTVLCCTLTALVILCTGADSSGLVGADMVIYSFSSALGGAAAYFIAGANTVFAFASMLGWYFYGEKCAEYLSPEGRLTTPYRLAYTAAAYFGAVISLDLVLELADLFNGLMMMINLTAILILSKEAAPYAKGLKRQHLKKKQSRGVK